MPLKSKGLIAEIPNIKIQTPNKSLQNAKIVVVTRIQNPVGESSASCLLPPNS
jgi:glycerate kinase